MSDISEVKDEAVRNIDSHLRRTARGLRTAFAILGVVLAVVFLVLGVSRLRSVSDESYGYDEYTGHERQRVVSSLVGALVFAAILPFAAPFLLGFQKKRLLAQGEVVIGKLNGERFNSGRNFLGFLVYGVLNALHQRGIVPMEAQTFTVTVDGKEHTFTQSLFIDEEPIVQPASEDSGQDTVMALVLSRGLQSDAALCTKKRVL